MRGWSVNVTAVGHDHETELPSGALFVTSEGPVVELVFWSEVTQRWIHAVESHFSRELPAGHVQVALGDLAWLTRIVRRLGEAGIHQCVVDLEEAMIPGDAE
jgi:hypothetical protein